MNKQRIHDILSSIQMSPRDKKDLVNAIFNSGGINESTPIKESVDGTELVPIFDGENKAVSVNELIKNSKEVYAIDLDNFKTSEDFNNLKNAINSNKIISINSEIASSFQFGSGDGVEFVSFITLFNGYSIEDPAEFSIEGTKYSFLENGRCDITYFGNITEGDGTKFLSDDGTYKTISTSNSSIPQLNSMFYVETNNVVFDSADVDILNNNRKVILTLQYGSGSDSTYEYIVCDVIYRSASTNTYQPTIIGHYFYNNKTYIVTFTAVKSGGNISVSPICIDDLNTKVNNLESRIAALESATA